MTQRETLNCIHEPFGDAFYYGPERMSERFENDEQTRLDSGFSESTYQTILDRFERESDKVCRSLLRLRAPCFPFPPSYPSLLCAFSSCGIILVHCFSLWVHAA